jgi:nitroreductase
MGPYHRKLSSKKSIILKERKNMNETMKSILNRRSTRVFMQEQIKEAELKTIIEAGLYAPSAGNEQSWHFTVIQSKALLDEINQAAKENAKNSDILHVQQNAHNEKFHVFYHAPTAIIVSGENKGFLSELDCAAATENMLIAAESLGVGSCWIAFATFAFNGEKNEAIKQHLALPEGYTPYYAISLGYKKSNNTTAPERKPNRVNYL